jgi:hypothetical protein
MEKVRENARRAADLHGWARHADDVGTAQNGTFRGVPHKIG